MATLSSLGIGSGLDVSSILSALMQVERQPLEAVKTQISTYQSKISAYGTLKSALSTFQTSASALSDASKFNAQKATSSDEDVLTATTDGTTTVGSFELTVSQLAKSQKIASGGFSDSDTTTLGTGTMTISYGTYDSTGNTFTANSDKDDLTITIDSSNNTLEGIRDAINDEDGDVTATIVYDGSDYRLVVTSNDTGLENTLKITVDDDDATDTDTSGLSQIAYDPTAAVNAGENMSELQAALDAEFTIDGIDIVSASNSVDDVVEGLTIELLATTDTGESVTLDIESDDDTITDSIKEFVSAYNKLNSVFDSLTFHDEDDSSKNGKLIGDATVRTISYQIREIMTDTFGSGTLTSLSEVGVSFDDDGNLVLDEDTLADAIDDNFSDIAMIFSANASFTDSQIRYVGSTSATQEGTYAINVTTIGSSSANFEGTINSVGATGSEDGLTGAPDDDSEGLEIKIYGSATGSRGTVTFTKGAAAQLDELIEEFLDDDDGLIITKTDGMNDSIDSLEEKSDRMGVRLAIIEARYRAQYSRLDTLLSNMNSTSSYLTQQLSALSS